MLEHKHLMIWKYHTYRWSGQQEQQRVRDILGAGGTFNQVQVHFQYLQERGTARGYYPEPTKSILVVAPGNVAWYEEHFRGLGIRVVTGHRYLGGFLGDAAAEREWLEEKVQGWTESVRVLAGVALKHPQSAYAGLQNSPNRSGILCRG